MKCLIAMLCISFVVSAGGAVEPVSLEREVLPLLKLRCTTCHPEDEQSGGLDLTLSESADKYRLLRRVTYVLIGYPPTPEEFTAFVQDTSPRGWPIASMKIDRGTGSLASIWQATRCRRLAAMIASSNTLTSNPKTTVDSASEPNTDPWESAHLRRVDTRGRVSGAA